MFLMVDSKKNDEIILTPEKPKEYRLTPKQERFCRLYAQNRELFGNATLCYATAYEYNLDSLDRKAVIDPETKEILKMSDYDRACNVCAVGGKQLLRKPKIDQRVSELLREMLTPDIIDAEISRTILQNEDRSAKMRAISEFNKLQNRTTTTKVDMTSDGKPIKAIGIIGMEIIKETAVKNEDTV